MPASYTSEEIAKATGGVSKASFTVDGVVIDSRKVQKGSLFFAIKGERVDGHEFAAKAVEMGAGGVVVAREIAGIKNQIIVKDTLAALTDLSAYARKRSKAKFIGITGSVGKTSVKEATSLMLAAYATEGNYNNHIGVPLTLCNIPDAAEYAVIEMGMNHAGEIEQLTKLALLHVAVITSIEAAHLEFFKSVEEIADAKAEILLGLEAGGAAVLPFDNPHYDRIKKQTNKKIISFGEKEGASVQMLSWKLAEEGSEILCRINDKEFSFRAGVKARHQAMNCVIAVSVAHALGLNAAKYAEKLATMKEGEGRGAEQEILINGKQVTVIDDSYNASPASMRASLEALKTRKGRKIAALGDMLELGEKSAELHAGLVKKIESAGVDLLICCGKLMKNLHLAAQKAGINSFHFESYVEAEPYLLANLESGDTLLVKGSHGSGMYKLAARLLGTEKEKKIAV